MTTVYKLTENKITDEHGTTHKTFGINVCESETGTVLRSIEDIFTDRRTAEDLVSLCNRLELSPCHIDDVIEDILVKI